MLHVNVATGEVCLSAVDFSLPGLIPFEMERNYRSHLNRNGILGWNWRQPLDVRLEIGTASFSYWNEYGVATPLAAIAVNREGLIGQTEDSQFRLFQQPDANGYVLCTPDRSRLYFSRTTPAQRILYRQRHEDVFGNALTFEHDADNRLSGLRDTFRRHVQILYGPNGKLAEFRLTLDRSANKHLTLARYLYNDHDDLIAVYDACGQHCGFEYQNHLLVRAVNRTGGTSYAEYDAEGRCVQTWRDNNKRLRSLRFDSRRRVTSVTNSRGSTTVYRWNEANMVVAETNAWGATRQTILDDNNALITVLDEAGFATPAMIYDPVKRIRTIVDAQGATTIAQENDDGQLVSLQDAGGGTTQWHYDANGKVAAVVTGPECVTRFDYDAHGFLIRATDPAGHAMYQKRSPDGTRLKIWDDLGPLYEYHYDILGNLIGVTDGAGAHHTLRRDALGRLLEHAWPDGSCVAWRYDAEGNLLEMSDELGHRWHYQRDKFGQCLGVTGPLGHSVRYEFDSEDELITVINELGQRHHFRYDALGRVCQQQFFDGTAETYHYDERGKIVAIVDGSGTTTRFGYDSVGNPVVKEFADGTSETFAYDGMRRLVEMRNNAISIAFQWDPQGNLIQEQQGDRILTFEYDRLGNRTRLKTSDGRELKYVYDARRRLTALHDNITGEYRFQHNPTDDVLSSNFPNGVTWHQEIDQRRRVTRQQLNCVSGASLLFDYQFDPADRLIGINSAGGRQTFQYDACEQLTSAVKSGAGAERYDYDANGNLTFWSRRGQLTYRPGNLLESLPGVTFEHDAQGALTQVRENGGDTRFEYDASGRMSAVVLPDGSRTDYVYDPLGRRVAKHSTGQMTEFVWDGFVLLSEIRAGNPTHYLLDAQRMLPLAQSIEGKTEYFAADRRGCVVATTDEQGQLRGQYHYSPFGQLEPYSSADRSVPPFRLRGQYFDQETGLHYNLHRYYDPGTGRFLTRDPLGVEVGRNLYRLGLNPLTWEDPFGLKSECQGDVFYRVMSDKELKRVMADCQLKAKQSKCPEGPYVTQNREYCERAQTKEPEMYKNLVEICTKPGTAEGLSKSPLACRNGSQGELFPNLPNVVSGKFHRIEHKMERGSLNYGLSKGDGLKQFNGQIEGMKVVGTGQTCVPG